MAVTVEKFEPGDVIYLKSGGPSMTVEAIKESMVHVQWFVGDNIGAAWLDAVTVTKTKPKGTA